MHGSTLLHGGLFVALIGGGYWLGEEASPLGVVNALGGTTVLVLGTWLILNRRPRRLRALLAGGTALLFFCAFIAGAYFYTQSFNDCIDRGEEVRMLLKEYKKNHGQYPAHLAELQMRRLPGRLLLHPDLLHYFPNPHGYELEFSDWLVVHRATQSQRFEALK